MKIKLTVQLDIEGQKLMKSGDFTVRWEENIPSIAYKWIRQIKVIDITGVCVTYYFIYQAYFKKRFTRLEKILKAFKQVFS